MANQLHYQFDQYNQENILKSFSSLPSDEICLIDDCFDENDQPINESKNSA